MILFGILIGTASLIGDWFVRLVRSSDGHLSLVVIEAFEVTRVPSSADACGIVIGTRPPFVSPFSFSMGWRTRLKTARFESRNEVGGGLLIATMDWGANQYYAVCKGKLTLVRKETKDGVLSPNNYIAPNITVGPAIPSRSEEEWEKALLSNEEAEILRTLVWLGGYHAPPDAKPIPMLLHEDVSEARLAYDVHSRPAVRRRIEELSKSSNPWIQEAAKVALEFHATPLSDPGGPPRIR